MITNDGVILAILVACLGSVFYTSSSSIPLFRNFYRYVPPLLLCYLLPGLLNTFGVIDPSKSSIYYVASRYLLPAALVLFIVSVDLRKIVALGSKAMIMFLAGTAGIIIGGPIALFLGEPMVELMLGSDLPASEEVWRGMSTLAGAWIGGGGNQVAMKELWQVDQNLFAAMAAIDAIAANVWLAVLLILARKANQLDQKRQADTRAIDDLKQTVQQFEKEYSRRAELNDLIYLMVLAFGAVGLAHGAASFLAPWFSDLSSSYSWISKAGFDKQFFWLVVMATTLGLFLSFTRARNLEQVGASKYGSLFIYLLVASIGMQIDLSQLGQYFGLFIIGLIWLAVHALVVLVVAYWIKAPTFFMAVGSQANVGGAASAPVIAAAFHPSLAPVGALLAILGYVLGTYGAIVCTYLLRSIS